jgi:vacuolar-type H+-ATPase subunit D/Vma8
MGTIASTRMELLARQAQLKLAVQGYDLLEQKRAALMEEILRLADVIMARAGWSKQRPKHFGHWYAPMPSRDWKRSARHRL